MNTFAVIGVGNMAKAILAGIAASNLPISDVVVFDKNTEQYQTLPNGTLTYTYAHNVCDAVSAADIVLLSVKPQNYDEVLSEIAMLPNAADKLYISIGAGITASHVSHALHGAKVVRVLPNVPILIGLGVALICRNETVPANEFQVVCDIFNAAGTSVVIDEADMNRMIGVTSSSPAYVFRFIKAMYDGAMAQGLSDNGSLLSTICDTVIASAEMLKQTNDTPDELIAKVASKGGTTERALLALSEGHFDAIIAKAMLDCTRRADELGNTSNR